MKRFLLVLLLCAAALPASIVLHLQSGTVTLPEHKPAFPGKSGRLLAVAVTVSGVDVRLFSFHRLTPLAYVPDRAYLLWLDGKEWTALTETAEIKALAPWKTEWKRGVLPLEGLCRALVVKSDPRPHLETQRLRLSSDQIEPFLARPDVVWLEGEGTLTLRNDTTSWVIQSNLSNARPLYDHGLHGEGEIVGHIDGQVWTESCYFIDPDHAIGPDHRKIVAYRSSTGYGKDGHGTHTAGTVCGEAEGEPHNGIAYKTRLSFTNIADIAGWGNSDSNLYQYLEAAHADGARLYTNSWGDDGTTAYTTWCYDIDRFSYDHPEDLVFFSATNQNTLKTPENAKNVVAVGGSYQAPNQGSRCTGGKGPTRDGRLKPDLYFPGCGIHSASSTQDCATTTMSGTSMASPAAAGTAALVRQYFREGFYPSGERKAEDGFIPSGALIKATLINSAQDMTGEAGYPSNAEGWGRPQLDQTLPFSGGARMLWLQDVPRESGLSMNEERVYGVTVQSTSQPLRITLAWTDYPALPNSSSAPVNDLDLEVTTPDGTVYLGNHIENGLSLPGGSPDALNNVEQVILPAPTEGAYGIRVAGTGVPMPPQGFALVATGSFTNVPRYYLPVLARAEGANRSLWRTDLWLFNPGSASQEVEFTYFPSGDPLRARTATFPLQPGESVYLEDPLQAYFGLASGVGSARLMGTGPLEAAVRLVNAASGAAFGQGYLAFSETFASGDTVYLPGLFIDGWRRTNIGFAAFDPEGGTAAATATLYDTLGNILGTAAVSIPSLWHEQNPLAAYFPHVQTLQNGTLELNIEKAVGLFPYASVVTSATGDGIFIPPRKAQEGGFVVPVLASAPNPTGHTWKTEFSLFSPAGGSFSGNFRRNTGTGWEDVALNLTLAGGASAYYEDFLQELGLAGGAGYLTFDGPFVPVTRIWSGTDMGNSMGQFIPSVNRIQTATHHWLPGFLPAANFRLNLGLENLEEADVLCQAVLWSASHEMLGETILGCPARNLIQQNATTLFGMLPLAEGGVIELSCEGPVLAYVSLVDGVTSDATLFLK
jgi:hypothetical protein